MNKCLVIFVEGDTDVEFYKQVVENIRKQHTLNRFDTNIEYKNVKGIGGFKNIALRKFNKEVKPQYSKNYKFTIVLCSDTDVFENHCFLESAIYGNATYIIPKENWEILSQKSKRELIDEKNIIAKIDHTEKWQQNISSMFGKVEI